MEIRHYVFYNIMKIIHDMKEYSKNLLLIYYAILCKLIINYINVINLLRN